MEENEKPEDTEVAASDEWTEEEVEGEEVSTKGVLPALARECERRVEARHDDPSVSAWIEVEPPTEQQEEDTPSIIGNWDGKPIKTGFMTKDKTAESQAENTNILLHRVYRTSKYNIHFRVREKEYTDEAEFARVGVTDETGTLTVTVPDTSPAAGKLRLVAQKETLDDELLEGWFSSEDETINAGDELTIDVDGEIEPGNEVTLTVHRDGETAPGAEVHMEGPLKLAAGEVFVTEVPGYK